MPKPTKMQEKPNDDLKILTKRQTKESQREVVERVRKTMKKPNQKQKELFWKTGQLCEQTKEIERQIKKQIKSAQKQGDPMKSFEKLRKHAKNKRTFEKTIENHDSVK